MTPYYESDGIETATIDNKYTYQYVLMNFLIKVLNLVALEGVGVPASTAVFWPASLVGICVAISAVEDDPLSVISELTPPS